MASREERRAALERRRRRVRRQRRGLVVAAALAAAIGVGLIVRGGGSSGAGPRTGPAPRTTATARRPPNPVDRTLAYTDYLVAGTARHREVALTFDDGPSPYTPSVLRILRRHRVAATFFPVGQPITAFGRYLRRVHAAGFPIGDHTMTHPLMGRLTPAAQAGQIDGQARLLRQAGVPYPRLFRPPDGSWSPATRALLARRRMLMVLWSVNPEDYYRPGAAAIVSRVMTGVRPGAIVLMHDGGGDRSQTVAALPHIIRRLRARHFRLVTIPRLLTDAPPPRGQGPPPNLSGVS